MRLLYLFTLLFFSLVSSLIGQSADPLSGMIEAYHNRQFDRVIEMAATLEEPDLPLAEERKVEALLLLSRAYGKQRRYEESHETTLRATELWKTTAQSDSDIEAAVQLMNGRMDHDKGAFKEADAHYKGGVTLFKSEMATDTSVWLLILAALAKNEYARSESQSAIEANVIAMALADRTQNISAYAHWRAYIDGAIMYYRIGEFEKGLVTAERSMELSKATDDPTNYDASLNTRSLTYGGMGRYDEQAADIRTLISRIGDVPNAQYYRVVNLHNLAGVYQKQGRYAEGVEAELRALEIIKQEGYDYIFSRAYLRLGGNYSGLGKYDKAIEATNEALRNTPRADLLTDRNGLPQVLPDSVRQTNIVRQILGERSNNLYAQRRFTEAERDLKSCLAIIEAERQRAKLAGSQYYLSSNVRPVYNNFVRLYAAQATNDDSHVFAWRALQTSDQGKAYSLAAQVGKDRYDLPEAERQLRYRIAELERQVVGDTTLRTELAESRLELQQIESTAQREGTTVNSLNQLDVENLLSDMSAHLLAYHLNADTLYLIHYTPEGKAEVYKLGAPNRLGERINDWRKSIQQSAYREVSTIDAGLQASYDAQFLELGLSLKRQLIPDGLKLGKHVLIIPDGSLHYLPFAALPLDSVAGPVDYASLTYFGDEHDISYGYSLAVLLALNDTGRASHRYETDLAAFAPRFGGNEEILAINEFQERSGNGTVPGLRPLTHNDEEVIGLGEQVGNTRVFVAQKATKQNFIEQLGRSKILHLATHGLSNHENQQLSYVAFNQSSDTLNEGELLYFNELPELPISAEMVVLSACETSLGPVANGESVLSMASAFTAGGARSTITTLWQVEDQAMQQMMGEMYANLVAGADRRQALQAAGQTLRRSDTYAHPKYWAGVHLHGQSGPIALKAGGRLNWNWIAGFLVGMTVIGLVILIENSKKMGKANPT